MAIKITRNKRYENDVLIEEDIRIESWSTDLNGDSHYRSSLTLSKQEFEQLKIAIVSQI